MELRQLECFVAVAEERHFGHAADRLGIGQPAVSQQVARLERALRIPLFARTSRRVALTEQGHEFLASARAVLSAADAARDRARHLAGDRRRSIEVGTCSGLGEHLHEVIATLSQLAPELDVRLTAVAARQRVRLVGSGQLAAAFTHDTVAHRDVRAVELWRDPLRVALPAGHALARGRAVRLAELADLPLRLVARQVNPPLYDLVMRACAQAGFQPRVLRAASTLEDILAEIGAGAPSWTVVYAARARRIRTRTEVFRPFAAPGLAVTTSLLVPAAGPSPDTVALLRACGIGAEPTSRD